MRWQRHRRWVLALALGLATVCPGRAWAEDASDHAPADEAASACVAKCESAHDACETKAKADAAACEQQKQVCDQGCARCRRLHGPPVYYCAQDCDRCRARYDASSCGKAPAPDDGACTRALDACLERCGP